MKELATQIKTGYKKTKLGWIPEDWEILTLQEMSISMKSGLSRKLASKDIGIPVIRSNNLNRHSVDFTDIKYWYVDDPQGANTNDYFLEEGDILINFINSLAQIGKCSIFRNELKRDVIYTTNILALRLNIKIIIPEIFLANTFLPSYLSYVKSITKPAVNQASFTTKEFKKLQLPIPPLLEQRKIAQILSTWDKAIAQTEKLIEQKQKRKQGLMQRLLTGKKRFKEFVKSDKLKQTKLGMIPEDWEEKRIGEISNVGAGGTPSTVRKDYWGGEIRWMNSGELNLKHVFEVDGRITELGLKNSSTKLIPINCVLIGLAGQGKTRGTAAINKVELCTNQSVAYIEPQKDVLFYNFLFYNLDYRYEELRRLSTGEGGRGGLNLTIIKGVRIIIPSFSEQLKIAETFSVTDQELDKLQTQLKQLKKQKKGLMQKLLTGEVRVKIDEV